MKSKVYNIALAACVTLLAFGPANAQDVAPVPETPPVRATKPVPSVRPVAPVAPAPDMYVYVPTPPAVYKKSDFQDRDAIEKSKTFSKSYPIDGNDEIQLDNSYGKIVVNTWDKKEVKVDVEIKAYANDDAEAQKLLDQTVINSSKDGNTVVFKTEINKGMGWWGTMMSNGSSSTHKVQINYMVYMPAKTTLSVSNKFGSTNLPELAGKVNVKSSYGSLAAKALTNTDNDIMVSYGSANIGHLSGGGLKVSYGSLNVTDADKLDAAVSYSSVKIGKLNSSGDIDLKYGGLQIDNLSSNLKALDVNSSYSPVKLGSVGSLDADFNVSVHYGGFAYGNTVNVTNKTPDSDRGFNPTKNYKGHIGKGGSDKMITIKSTYGSVKFD